MRVFTKFTVLSMGALIAASVAQNAAHASMDPIYSKLKIDRTYFVIRSVSPLQATFDVWFLDNDYVHCSVPYIDAAQLAAITRDSLECGDGVFGTPPQSVDPVPDAERATEQSVENKIRSFYPDAQQFVIAYTAPARRIEVSEYIIREVDPRNGPIYSGGSVEFATDANFTSLAEVKNPGQVEFYSGEGLLCPSFEKDACQTAPNFVPYRLLAGLEGSSLLENRASQILDFQEAWDAFVPILLKTAQSIAAGTYQNPIDRILNAQGDSVLPPSLNQVGEFDLTILGRTPNMNDQKDFSMAFKFLMGPAYWEGIDLKRTIPAAGLTLSLKASFQTGLMTLTVTDTHGNTQSMSFTLGSGVIVDPTNRSVALPGHLMAAPQAKGPMPVLTLPGYGGIKSIDIYPQSELRIMTKYDGLGDIN